MVNLLGKLIRQVYIEVHMLFSTTCDLVWFFQIFLRIINIL